ncbi:glycosyltransferase family 4 protein [Pseudomonas sp. 6D_7.1_Bac1]|uniref:glycosyltransferase family 4 protein n=1 Tax=Pseudomonas sp. 6D_7.1_Bac1 TaxID=2971615 RepID=UPI0021CA1355|nr:glycosyltransferase family 4 protein [Pseudomonas sp. 6D_7.1_Bac1]MCU1748894.1 glycosyltransferase family 4 protein [Pseudomonas sp. 6D_7.1_Bac1]
MKILIAGLYMPGSGLTSVMMRLALHMAERAHVSLLGFDPILGDARNVKVAGIPARLVTAKAGRMIAEASWLERTMSECRPDVFVVTGPASMARSLLDQLSRYRPLVRVVYYLPTEGSIVSSAILNVLTLTDDCVVFTDNARRDLIALMESAAQTSLPRLHVVGHGVDHDAFWASGLRGDVGPRHVVRQSFWSSQDPEEFVVLNVNRPYYRKRLDITIAGFGDFAKLYPRSRLVLHPGRLNIAQLDELETWRSSSGVPDRITVLPYEEPMSSARLNELYNVCDVGLTTAMGEGWGLTPFEHAATGAPQVVPDHTSFSENWTGAASMLPIEEKHAIFYEYADMHATSSHHVSCALEALAADGDKRKLMGSLAKARALDPKFSWERVGSRFFSILEQGVVQ